MNTTKNLNKTLTFIITISLLTASSALADDNKPKNHMRIDRKVMMLQKDLGLSDQQADQVFEIMKSSRENSKCRTLEKFSERKLCRETQRELASSKIDSILSDEQKVKFKEMREKRKEMHKKRGMHRKGRPRLDRE